MNLPAGQHGPSPAPVAVKQHVTPHGSRLWPAAGNALIGAWKLLVGGFLTQGLLGSILIVGWSYRLAQRTILKQWWKQSSEGTKHGRFRNFATQDWTFRQHQHWPNWLLEQNRAWQNAPRIGGWAGINATFSALFRSLWLNIKVGVQGLFNTFVFTLPGCVLMLFSWYAGWHNSFNKGYEQAAVGPLLGFTGILLFIAAMYYVPMAQMRQASTGDWRAFYQFKTVWQLIRRRWLHCLGLALLYSAISLPVTILKTVPGFFPQINPELVNLSAVDALAFAQTYYFYAGFVVFVGYVVLRWVAARIYASAALSCVQTGLLTEEALGEKEWEALHRLDLLATTPKLRRHFLLRTITWCGTRLGRATVGVVLFLAWFSFVAQVYAAEFLHRNEYNRGWLNHPLVQLPWFNYIPDALEENAATEME